MSTFTNFGLPPSVKLSAPYPAWSPNKIRIVELAILAAWQCMANDVTTKKLLDFISRWHKLGLNECKA